MENQQPAQTNLPDTNGIASLTQEKATESNAIEIPSISLPKGGGALKGIDEKFKVNSSNGTASFNIPLPLTSGRNGFTPQLSLSYNSGGGNSIFGLGWSLGIPSIQRKTDKKLPRYRDETDEDTFMFSGAEDLVPFLDKDNDWAPFEPTEEEGYIVKKYRPRLEGGFSKIEKIKNPDGEVYWKVTSRNNVVTFFGFNDESRIANPSDPTLIFQWLPSFSLDNKGNWIKYNYKNEDKVNVPDSLHEKNRSADTFTNTYLKSVQYGNRFAWYPFDFDKSHPSAQKVYAPGILDGNGHFFECVFDYVEHSGNLPADFDDWTFRNDAFSSYRSGFEIRTYRLCHRILMFHHFPGEYQKDGSEFGLDYLVRSMVFDYEHSSINDSGAAEVNYLKSITQQGHIRNEDGISTKSLPPLEFTYQHLNWNTEVKTVSAENIMNAPVGLTNNYQWADLYGEGISGILTEQGSGWYYKENWGKSDENGEAEFTPAKLVASRPSFSGLSNGSIVLRDLDADGRKQLVVNQSDMKGYFELSEDGEWENFVTISKKANINVNDPFTRLIDLNGDGKPELVVSEDNAFLWYPSLGKDGYETPERSFHSRDEEQAPSIVFADPEQTIFLADMSGDGLTDIVRIRNGEICYWANMGYGKFSAKINMSNAPVFDSPDLFNPQYLHLADVSGTGATDIIYLGRNKFQAFINHSGNSWSDVHEIEPSFPYSSNSKLSVIDLLGTGTSCIVWSSDEPQHSRAPMRYIDLMDSKKPHVMIRQINNMGKETLVEYKSSTWYYLQDKKNGTPWITKLPFPVQVVSKVVIEEKITNVSFSSSYTYHHGYYDHPEKEFRGFGFVEQTDAESFETYKEGNELDIPPVYTKSWFHTGAHVKSGIISRQYATEYYSGDEKAYLFPDSIIEGTSTMNYQNIREAYRALKGKTLRQEIYSKDGSDKEEIPFTVNETNYSIRQLQPGSDDQAGVFMALGSETLTYSYERNPDDPRIAHVFVLESDDYGHPLKTVNVAYPRRNAKADHDEQKVLYLTAGLKEYFNNETELYLLGVPIQEKTFEISGITIEADGYVLLEELKTSLANAFDDSKILLHYEQFTSGIQARLISQSKSYFSDTDNNPLAFGTVQLPLLPHHVEQLVMSEEWANQVYGDKIDDAMMVEAGYFKESDHWWNPGNVVSYLTADKFYLPYKTTDAFGKNTTVTYDSYSLATIQTEDAKGNTLTAELDYRTLAPKKLIDINDNVSEAITDPLGMVIATSIYGTENGMTKGDNPISDYVEIEFSSIDDIVNDPQKYLQEATGFFYYSIEKWSNGMQPPHFISLQRETHVSELKTGEEFKIQIRLGYSDAFGRELQAKVKVRDGEIDCDPGYLGERWLTSGRTIYNNKEKPIKQYEPDYRPTYQYEDEETFEPCGVTPIIYYDPMGRIIKTETPKGFHSKVEFNPWQVTTWDENDTVKDTDFYTEHIVDGDDEAYALAKASEHSNTPTTVILDSLSREFKMVQIRKTGEDELITLTKFDILGNPTTITDPRQVNLNKSRSSADHINNFVFSYDLLGNKLYTNSMDAGETWGLINVMGNPVHGWNGRNFHTSSEYDELHRPVKAKVEGNGINNVVQLIEYTDNNPSEKEKNRNGQAIKFYDQAGLVENRMFDFHGLLTETTRQIRSDYKNEVDWSVIDDVNMEGEIFTTKTSYDAIGRANFVKKPDGSITVNEFHGEGWLNKVDVKLKGEINYTSFIQSIDYNAKGQRTKLVYGNEVRTTYAYEKETFRLEQMRSYRRESDGSDTSLQDICYVYDPVGNIVKITDNSHENVFTGGAIVEPKHEYKYDALYQLVEANGREHKALNKTDYQNNADTFKGLQFVGLSNGNDLSNYSRKYTYDVGGNLTEIKHTGTNAFTRTNIISPHSNRAVSDGMGVTKEKVDDYYDKAGNLIKLDHIRNIDWNYRNNISFVCIIERNSENDGEYYVYDASGERIRKVKETHDSNGTLLTTEEKIYLGGVELKRKYQGNSKTLVEDRSANHIMDDQKRIAITYYWTLSDSFDIEENKTHYQLGNHLGSASMELDEDGLLISYEEYFPFGGTSYTIGKNDTEVKLKEYRYTGKERDDATALYYYGARYYAPWIGRWLNPDPVGIENGSNLNEFVLNNPVRFTDATGLTEEDTVEHKLHTRTTTLHYVHVGFEVIEETSKFVENKHLAWESNRIEHLSKSKITLTNKGVEEWCTKSMKLYGGSKIFEHTPKTIEGLGQGAFLFETVIWFGQDYSINTSDPITELYHREEGLGLAIVGVGLLLGGPAGLLLMGAGGVIKYVSHKNLQEHLDYLEKVTKQMHETEIAYHLERIIKIKYLLKVSEEIEKYLQSIEEDREKHQQLVAKTETAWNFYMAYKTEETYNKYKMALVEQAKVEMNIEKSKDELFYNLDVLEIDYKNRLTKIESRINEIRE